MWQEDEIHTHYISMLLVNAMQPGNGVNWHKSQYSPRTPLIATIREEVTSFLKGNTSYLWIEFEPFDDGYHFSLKIKDKDEKCIHKQGRKPVKSVLQLKQLLSPIQAISQSVGKNELLTMEEIFAVFRFKRECCPVSNEN